MWEKLKSFLRNDAYFMALLIILVGVGSYGLGRLSMIETDTRSLKMGGLTELTNIEPKNKPEISIVTPVVVSRSGTKYHLFNCPGAVQMKEENRIEFASIEAAKAAGYSPAANCPGL